MHPFGNHLARVTIKGRDIEGRLKKRFMEAGYTIQPDRNYVVATNDYATQSIRVERLIGKNSETVIFDDLVRDVVAGYIKEYGIDKGAPYASLGYRP